MKLIKQFIDFFLLSGTEKEIESNEIVHENILRFRYLTLISIPVNVVVVALFGLKVGNIFGPIPNWDKEILILNILIRSLFIIFSIVITWYSFRLPKSFKMVKIYFKIMLVMLLLGAAIIVETDETDSVINRYLVICFALGLVVLMRPLLSMLYYFSAYFIYYKLSIVIINPAMPNPIQFDHLNATVICLLISFVLWNAALNRIKQKRLMVQTTTRLELATRAGGIGIWEYDIVNNNLIWDNQLFELFGIGENEIRDAAKVWLNRVHPQDLQRVEAETKLAILGEKEYDTEYRIVWPDGSIHYLMALATVIRDVTGRPTHMIGTNWDITKRKQAEEHIIKLAKGIEQSPASIFITDTSGNIEFVNPKFCELSGFTMEEAIGNNSSILKSGQTTQAYYENLWTTIQSGKEWHGEFYNKKKNGEFYWERASISPIINAKGEITNFIAVKEDITKEKRNEEALVKAKQEADAANKAKSTFLANMSHEIRTPLNAIIGFSQLMDREKLLTGQSKEYASSINRAGEHLLRLINDILELSKVEAGKVVLKPINFDLNTLLNDLNVIFMEQVKSKNLSLTFETAPEVPRYVVADEGKLLQIFINLIGNAVKFTDKGGIVVRTKVDPINGVKNRLIVEIEDTGLGIAQDEMDKVFKTFEQTSSGIKQGSGTGLGLALCRELTILMGGNIDVASEVGKGSVFTFHVVIKGGDVVGVKTKTAKRVVGMAKGQKAVQVLVVDDKEENLKVAVNFLQLAGFETVEATNGKDAIAKFEESNPDLILMDFRMPVMDGYEAVQRIRSTEKGKLVPIVAISASMFDGEEIKIKMLDLQGFIHKPFREDEFYGTIGKVLGIQYIFEEETTLPPTDYLYDEDTASVDISKLPEGIQLNLRKAAEMADSDLMVEILNSNIIVNQELADHLMRVANNFEWDYLHRILKNT